MNAVLAFALVAATAVPRFERGDQPIALTGPARPTAYMEASGRRAAFIGREDGTFEAWVYPLKVLHGFDLAFALDRYRAPVEGVSLARQVDIRPESSTVRYAHDAFTADATWLVPLEEAGGVVLLDVDASEDLSVQVRFRTDLQLMWPAAIGGQYSYWDPELSAYVITESTRKPRSDSWARLSRSEPPGKPAHNLPDAPTELEIPVSRRDGTIGGLVPIVIAASVEGLDAEATRSYDAAPRRSTESLYRETAEPTTVPLREELVIDRFAPTPSSTARSSGAR